MRFGKWTIGQIVWCISENEFRFIPSAKDDREEKTEGITMEYRQ